jgi:Glycine/D-amino acid oxidases (deaminating)
MHMPVAALSVLLNQFENNLQTTLELHSQGLANLPVPNPTRSFWIDTPGANPLAKEGSEGPLTDDASICIIGSGITGISTAYHLSKSLAATNSNSTSRPIKAVVLEARDFC